MNPYRVLGISSSDNMASAKTKYRRLCKIYHPDNLKTGDREKLDQVVEAWKIIEELGLDGVNEIWGHKTLFSLKRRKV